MQDYRRETTPKAKPFAYYLVYAVCLALILLLCPLPQMNRLFRYGMDLLHTPFFTIFAFFLDQKRRKETNNHIFHLFLFTILLCILAVGLEAAQSWAGRDTSWHDGLSNILGIFAGVLFSRGCATKRKHQRWFVRSLGVLLLISGSIYGLCGALDTLQAEVEFPILADFETQNELLRWEMNDAYLMRSGQYAISGEFSGKIVFKHGHYPGVSMELPRGDWSAYRSLTFGIAWPSNGHLAEIDQNEKKRLTLHVKLEDDGPSDLFHDRFESKHALHPGKNRIRIPITKIAGGQINRPLRFDRMKKLSLFITDSKNTQVLFIDGIRLE